MTWRTFLALSFLYVAAFALVWWAFDREYKNDDIPGWHYAIDTVTLRGRISDPSDKDLWSPTFLRVSEDIASLAIFIVLGFGVAFSIGTLDDLWNARLFHHAPPNERKQFPTFKQWVQQKHPESYHQFFPQDQGPRRSGLLRRTWLLIKRWLLGV